MVLESIPHRRLSSEVASDVERGVRFRYQSIRSSRARAILQIQHQLSRVCRHILDSLGFTEVLAPIIGPVTDPGIRGAGTIEVPFYGKIYVLMTSMILYKQMTMASIPRVYSFSPNVRLEPSASSRTGRHLAEFYQLDLEVAHATCEEVMALGDTLMFEAIDTVRKECSNQLEELERTLHLPPRRLPRITYTQALDILSDEGFDIDPASELPWKAEYHLSKLFVDPFWITDYPATARSFYYLRNADHPSFLKSMDLVLPEGYGEVSSGGEREYTIEGVMQRMVETREDVSKYAWYLDMLEEGIPPSAGFGIGLERLTRYLCGVSHIWECSPFPKVPGLS
ncbi:MAG: asparagine synthetase A [Candidatus Thorarchaeota archaeon]